MVAGHQVAAGPEVCLAPGKAGGHLPGDRDEDLRVLLAVPQVDRGGHLLKAEAPPAAIPEQISGHHGGPLPVALPQVGDQELLGIGGSIRWVVNRSASGSRQARPPGRTGADRPARRAAPWSPTGGTAGPAASWPGGRPAASTGPRPEPCSALPETGPAPCCSVPHETQLTNDFADPGLTIASELRKRGDQVEPGSRAPRDIRDTVCGGYAGNGPQVTAAFQEPRDQPAPPGRQLRVHPHPQAIGRDRTRMLSYLPL